MFLWTIVFKTGHEQIGNSENDMSLLPHKKQGNQRCLWLPAPESSASHFIDNMKQLVMFGFVPKKKGYVWVGQNNLEAAAICYK